MSGGPQPAGGNVCRRAADDINISSESGNRRRASCTGSPLPAFMATTCEHACRRARYDLHRKIERHRNHCSPSPPDLGTQEWRRRTSEGSTKCARTTKFSSFSLPFSAHRRAVFNPDSEAAINCRGGFSIATAALPRMARCVPAPGARANCGSRADSAAVGIRTSMRLRG